MLISEQTWLTLETTVGRTCLFALVSFFYMCLYHLAERVLVSEKVSAKELCLLVTLSMGPLFRKTLEADSQLVLSVVFMLYCFPTDLFEAIVNYIFILGCSLLLHRNTILSPLLLLNLLVLLVFLVDSLDFLCTRSYLQIHNFTFCGCLLIDFSCLVTLPGASCTVFVYLVTTVDMLVCS